MNLIMRMMIQFLQLKELGNLYRKKDKKRAPRETKEPKSKELAATLSDYEGHLSSEYEGKGGKYMAFTASTDEVKVESAGECEHDFEEETPKQLTF